MLGRFFFKCLIIVFALNLQSCNSNKKQEGQPVNSKDMAKLVFKNTEHDFGTINEGDVVSTVYEFKNAGTMPLEIADVKVSCGCTVAEKPEKPIGAGQFGSIKVKFNSEGKAGVNKKFVTVTSNAINPSEMVSFSVIVNKKN